jgi:hypothetical protein
MNDPKDWTDKEFLDYVEIHSKTDRALFSNTHIERFARLAGLPHLTPNGGFNSMFYDDISILLADAYKNIEKSNETLP